MGGTQCDSEAAPLTAAFAALLAADGGATLTVSAPLEGSRKAISVDQMNHDLIYDVGVNDGEDSAYYLSRGYRVVGIEADPLLAQRLTERFADEIRAGAFVLVNVGIADQEGEADFWVSERTLWSSFNREMASRDGLSSYPVKVRTRRLADLFTEFGTPFYCKVDIEGYDSVCVRSLDADTAPKYLSMEFDVANAAEDLRFLKELGYAQFKIISQATRSQPSPTLMSLACRMPYRVAAFLRRSERRWRGVTSLNGTPFGEHSSGPFAEETPGRWRTYEEAVELWQFLNRIDKRRETKGLHDWFDIHAKAAPAS
jgi:FkbM family methyltransferase